MKSFSAVISSFMDLKEIRALIRTAEIEAAIDMLAESIPKNYEDEYLLLASNYHLWKKEENLGLKPPTELRNKTIYGLLMLVSEIESVQKNNLGSFAAKVKKRYEEDLHRGYDYLHRSKYGSESLQEILKAVSDSSTSRLKLSSDPIQKKEFEEVLEKVLKKYERLYQILCINLVLMAIGLLLSPIFFVGKNLGDEVVHEMEDAHDSDEADDGDE